MTTIAFTVFGTPQQVGSKNSYVPLDKSGNPYRRKGGGVMVQTTDQNKKARPWMAAVRSEAAAAYRGELLQGPVMVTARFYFSRPAAHYGAKGIKPKFAGEYCTKVPDLDKLLRAVGDAMSGIIYGDDKQVVRYGDETCKYWTAEQERCEIVIETLGEKVETGQP
jgi:crossover junction endodeoxyribonuclease RusA